MEALLSPFPGWFLIFGAPLTLCFLTHCLTLDEHTLSWFKCWAARRWFSDLPLSLVHSFIHNNVLLKLKCLFEMQLNIKQFCSSLSSVFRCNGSLPYGDKGRRKSRFALCRRNKANGVKPSTVHMSCTPQAAKVRVQHKWKWHISGVF